MAIASTCPIPGHSRARVPIRSLVFLFVALVLLSLSHMAKAQEQPRIPKVPGISKSSTGPVQQMFSGVLKSIDLKEEILNVDAVNGNTSEMFPIRGKIHVSTADGDKIKLEKLKPGTNVLVYYDQKGERRTVTRIVVLAGSQKKKNPPL